MNSTNKDFGNRRMCAGAVYDFKRLRRGGHTGAHTGYCPDPDSSRPNRGGRLDPERAASANQRLHPAPRRCRQKLPLRRPTPDPNVPVAVFPTPAPGEPAAIANYNTAIFGGPGTNYVVYAALTAARPPKWSEKPRWLMVGGQRSSCSQRIRLGECRLGDGEGVEGVPFSPRLPYPP